MPGPFGTHARIEQEAAKSCQSSDARTWASGSTTSLAPASVFEGKDGAMHPILVRIPFPAWKFLVAIFTSIPIHSYGVMLGLSLVVGWYLTLGLAEQRRAAQRDAGQLLRVHRALGRDHVARPLLRDQPRRVQIVLGVLRAVARRARGLRRLLGRLSGLGRLSCGARSFRFGRGPTSRRRALAAGLMLTRIGCYLFGCDFGKPLPLGRARSGCKSAGHRSRIGRRHASARLRVRRPGCSTCSTICSTSTRPASLARAPDADLRVARGRPRLLVLLLWVRKKLEVPRAALSHVHVRLRRAAVSCSR